MFQLTEHANEIMATRYPLATYMTPEMLNVKGSHVDIFV